MCNYHRVYIRVGYWGVNLGCFSGAVCPMLIAKTLRGGEMLVILSFGQNGTIPTSKVHSNESVILYCTYFNHFEIGFTIALGAFLTYPCDIPSSLKHKINGIIVTAF